MLQNIDLSDVDIICTTGQVAEEPYTTENLSQLTGGYKMLTNVTELLRVNFCNPHVSTLRFLNKAKTKYMCGSYYMVLKNRVGR